jgi:hypothetical protein
MSDTLEFDTYFGSLIEKTQDRNLRMIKLERPIPEVYEKDMDKFLQKFFEKDPFEFKPDDLEEVMMNGKVIKQIKVDRRPVTYLSLLRFLELHRQRLSDIKQDISALADVIKEEKASFQISDSIKSSALNEALAAGRIYKNIHSLTLNLYLKLVRQINSELEEAKHTQGRDAFINLRKMNSESFLRTSFHPYYEKLFMNSMFMMAVSKKIRKERLQLLTSMETIE